MIKIGIDLSLRCTGIVVLNGDTVEDFIIVNSDKKTLNDESLLISNQSRIADFLSRCPTPDEIILEKLSLSGKNGQRDLIDANWWMTRIAIRSIFPDVPLSTPTVQQWRKHVGDTAKQKRFKAKFDTKSKKVGLKRMCVHALTSVERKMFRDYIKVSKCKRDSLYDLSDARFIAKYGGKI